MERIRLKNNYNFFLTRICALGRNEVKNEKGNYNCSNYYNFNNYFECIYSKLHKKKYWTNVYKTR